MQNWSLHSISFLLSYEHNTRHERFQAPRTLMPEMKPVKFFPVLGIPAPLPSSPGKTLRFHRLIPKDSRGLLCPRYTTPSGQNVCLSPIAQAEWSSGPPFRSRLEPTRPHTARRAQSPNLPLRHLRQPPGKGGGLGAGFLIPCRTGGGSDAAGSN